MVDLIAGLLEWAREFEEPVWFRGQANTQWPLLPSALRDDFLDAAYRWAVAHPTELQHRTDWRRQATLTETLAERRWLGSVVEQIANVQFRRQASPLLADPDDLRAVYMEARHAGLPSRLLDWTTHPLIALFFASYSEETDGRIYAVNPEDYYYFTTSEPQHYSDRSPGFEPTPVSDNHVAFTGQLPLLFGSTTGLLSAHHAGPEYLSEVDKQDHNHPFPSTKLEGVLPVLPTQHLPNIVAQRSCFTFHPPNTEGIPDDKLLEPFSVPASEKQRTIENLRLLGVDESTVWPNLDGAAKAIRSSLGLP